VTDPQPGSSNITVDWTQYMAPWINDILPGDAHALRDFGLLLGAVTLARLAWAYDPPGLRR
jgi:hypothetical protein